MYKIRKKDLEKIYDKYDVIKSIILKYYIDNEIIKDNKIEIYKRGDGFYIFKFQLSDEKGTSEHQKREISSYISYYIKEYFGHEHQFHGYHMDRYINLHPIEIKFNPEDNIDNIQEKMEGHNLLLLETKNNNNKPYSKAVLGIRYSFLRIGNSVFRGLNLISKNFIHSGLWWLTPLWVYSILVILGYVGIYKISEDSPSAYNMIIHISIMLLTISLFYILPLNHVFKILTAKSIISILEWTGKKVLHFGNGLSYFHIYSANRYTRLIIGAILVYDSRFIYNLSIVKIYDHPIYYHLQNKEIYAVYASFIFLSAGVFMEILLKRTKKIKLIYYGISIIEYAKILYQLILIMCSNANKKASRKAAGPDSYSEFNCETDNRYENIQNALHNSLKYEYHKLFNAVFVVVVIVILIYVYARIIIK